MEILRDTKERKIMEDEKEERAKKGRKGKKGERRKKEEWKGIERKGRRRRNNKRIYTAIEKIEEQKALGENGIENEAWKLMPKEIGAMLYDLINRIWKEGRIPEEWNKGIISPI